MLNEAPPFWWKKNSVMGWLLAPIGYLYGRAAARILNSDPISEVPVPVICVGNFVTGGAGKTPTVELLTRYAKSKQMKPGILSRGYGGAVTTPTRVDPDKHNAHDVGDEALLHVKNAVTVVSADRPKGAKMLVELGCDVIIMDDGFQNPSLKKDFHLIVVDRKRGLGNGHSIPAGPLRAPLHQQLMLTDAAFLIGDGDAADKTIRKIARAAKPFFYGKVQAIAGADFKGMKALAFAGIADPSKFFDTLRQNGVEVIDTQAFGDHHVFTAEECEDLLQRAQEQELQLLTTTKDIVRMRDMGPGPIRLLEESVAVPVHMVPEDPHMLSRIFETAISRADARRIKSDDVSKKAAEATGSLALQ